jgi:hypothetical protein
MSKRKGTHWLTPSKQFLFVETKGRTLEELTEIFKGKNRVKRSVAKTEVVVHGNEGVTEVFKKDEA